MTIKEPNSFSRYFFTSDSAKNCFGIRLRNARTGRDYSQQQLAERIHKTRVVIANYETGKASPEPDIAIKLAKILGEDSAEYLLLSILQRVSSVQNTVDEHLLEIVNQLLKTKRAATNHSTLAGLQTHLSLMDFPNAFTPLTVVVGDKREEEPQNTGDLFVFSASTVDDRWLSSLGLPPDTEKISDKVLMTAENDKNWLKKHFGERHILCIGSPASNLFARIYNNSFLFRFAISRETQEKWQENVGEIRKLQTEASLLKFHEDHRADLKQKMRLFKPPGFVDFNYKHLRVGMDLSQGKDFAVVSLGVNPFADPEAPYFAILAAGVHHPGTAHAVKFLAEPANFEKHPFGGVLEVEVPSKNVDPRDIFWHNKIEASKIYWHTVGEDKLEYTPAVLLKKLEDWIGRLSNVVSDVILTPEELKGHITLIHKLATTKGNSESSFEKDDRVDKKK